MKKRFLLIPAIGLPLLTTIPTISSYSNGVHEKVTKNKTNSIAEADANNYTVIAPELTHYKVGEKLDLNDLKVTYNDPEKGAIDVTNECKLDMQNGQELTQEGEFDVTIKHNEFNSSFKIYVEKEPTEVPCANNIQKMGDINVEFKLMSNQECIFTNYNSGEGTLEIPDYVQDNGIKYFIKKIPCNWSDGANEITGLKFKCQHLNKICERAFLNTNCLDYYRDNSELLIFPEGLEEIGKSAFAGTSVWGFEMKGYSFPSTLKKIEKRAFCDMVPYDISELHFRSIPILEEKSIVLAIPTKTSCIWIYGNTFEMATQMCDALNESVTINSPNLVPKVIGDDADYPIVKSTWGDIEVEYYLINDECWLKSYISGSGKLVVPDNEEHNGKIYYIKRIPSDWSDGENDITGLEFKCNHLKKICDEAFKGTNCLDEYMKDKGKLLMFPEGLEEIGEYAFANTDRGQNSVRGYDFPSTLKKIGAYAFGKHAPYIDDEQNGQLRFRSIPEIHQEAFYVGGTAVHNCFWIYGSTLEIAKAIKDNLKSNGGIKYFKIFLDALSPRLIDESQYKLVNAFETPIKLGNIEVSGILAGDEFLMRYWRGTGTLRIPDHVTYENKVYYIKEIPANWSDGENDITGLEFEKDVSHLKKICDHAFDGTNCLDYYINHKDELLVFPEGLEEIGEYAFANTDRGQNSIKGYSFPSTLKKIGSKAFTRAPYIDGDDDNGVLEFKSVPEIASDAFYICGIPTHDCKFIKGKTQEMANQLVELFKNKMSDDFSTGDDYLIPQVIEEKNI